MQSSWGRAHLVWPIQATHSSLRLLKFFFLLPCSKTLTLPHGPLRQARPRLEGFECEALGLYSAASEPAPCPCPLKCPKHTASRVLERKG